MGRKRYSDEDVLKLLREIDVHLHDGLDVVSACRKAAISVKSYDYWRKRFGGLSRSPISEMKLLKKENERLKKIVADLQLDKVILKESLDHLKPRACRGLGFVRLLFIRVKSWIFLSGVLALFWM